MIRNIWKNLSIPTKVSTTAGILILLAFLVISFFNYQNEKNAIEQRILVEEVPILIDNVNALVQKELNLPITLTGVTAKNPLILKWLETGETNNQSITNYFKMLKKETNARVVNLVSDKSQKFYNDYGAVKVVKVTEPRDFWYFNFKKSGKQKEFNIGITNLDSMAFFVNYRIEDEKGNFLGVTGMGLGLNQLIKSILNKQIGKRGNIFLIDKEGFIKVHRNADLIHKNKFDNADKSIKKLEYINQIANDILKNQKNTFYYSKNGEKMVVHTKFIPEFDWFLIIEVSENEILAPIFTLFVENIIWGLFITAVVITFLILAIRRLVLHPLKKFKISLLSFFDFLNRDRSDIELIETNNQDELGKMSEVINKNILNIKNNIQQDKELLTETLQIIDIISNGNLNTKLESPTNNPELNSLKLEINEMLVVLQEKVGLDINRIVEVMQSYQDMNFEEKIILPKGTIENKVNEMGQSIYDQQQKISLQNQEIIRQKNEVEDFNKQLQSSVQAAFTIQQAIFPYEKKLDKLLKNYFIFSRPRDVVSGDFYWLNEINGKTLLIVGDCTGHGIPGAFMTLIGCTLLDKIVRVWDIIEPNLILERLHEEIKTVLRQEETGSYSGMDVSVLLLEKMPNNTTPNQQTKVIFSGAKNGFCFVSKENPNVVEEIKGSRRGIGGVQNLNIPFETHEFMLPKDSWIYAGSDGYADQCNPERKKFGHTNLKNMILQASRLSAQDQYNAFTKNLNQYQNTALQRDDILWIGVKL